MRSVFGVAFAARFAAVAIVSVLAAGCSSDITRLSQPFFSDSSNDDLTGSLGTVPSEDIPDASSQPRPAGITTAPLGSSSVRSSSVDTPNIPRDGGNGFLIVRAEPGDTAYSLSRRYGVSARSIMAANGLTNAEDFRTGQEVRIPPRSWNANASAAPVAAPKPPAPKPVASAERTHIVRSGETLYGIGRTYGMQARDIERYNDLDSADKLKVGQRLKIPAHVPVRTASLETAKSDVPPVPATKPVNTTASKAPAPVKTAAAPAPKPSTPPVAAKPTQVASLNTGEKEVSAPTKLPEPPALTSSNFRWPVRGRVIAEFGKKANGSQNDGINVAVPEGTSVKAAENGVVAYVGNELKGFGNLVLIRHSGDWVTAYAHNSQILVKRGDQVSRGQIIAKAGKTGSVRQPQLHFELRKGSRPVDPLPHLADNS